MPSPAATPFSAAFRRLACSNLAAQLSEQLALAAAPLVAVLLLGAGAAGTGALQTAQTLPFLLLALPAGVLAERASRRRLMAGAEALRAATLLATLLLLLAGHLTLPLLAVLGFLGAAGTVAYGVAAPAILPALVPRDRLASANRLLELARVPLSPRVPRWAARRSAGPAPPPPTPRRRRCPSWRPPCWPASPSRSPPPGSAGTSCTSSAKAPPSSPATRSCARCCSPPCSSTLPGSYCRPST